MRLAAPAMLVLITYACFATATAWPCDLREFDRTPPAAVRSEVHNRAAHFEWASDVDTVNGRTWIWHYILNKRTDSAIGVTWKKAHIKRHLANPLPPGESDCNRFLANTVEDAPDTQAPIIYGTADASQDAAIFVEKQQSAAATTSIIETSFVNAKTKILEKVSVYISTGPTPKGIGISIQQTPNVILALGSIGRALNSQQYDTLVAAAKSQDGRAERAAFVDYLKGAGTDGFQGLYTKDEVDAKLTGLFVFFSGTKFGTEIQAERTERVAADLILLDRSDNRPLFATEVKMLLPAAHP
jgi:hypothetical protein